MSVFTLVEYVIVLGKHQAQWLTANSHQLSSLFELALILVMNDDDKGHLQQEYLYLFCKWHHSWSWQHCKIRLSLMEVLNMHLNVTRVTIEKNANITPGCSEQTNYT